MDAKHYCDFLEELLNSPSPSGYERFGSQEEFKRFCRDIDGVKEEFTDTMGNCAFSIGNDVKGSVMISGHIDEIGFQVSMITEEGLVHVLPLGGVDLKCSLGQQVDIISSRLGQKIPGIIGKKPIHIEYDDRDSRWGEIKPEDILIDIGEMSKDKTELQVSIGDPVVFKSNLIKFFGDGSLCMSKGLDDKVGVFISALVLKQLSYLKPEFFNNYKIWCVSTTQEEVGLRGAMRAVKKIGPTYSIDVDVTFATDEGRGIKKETYGDIKLGGGPVIMHGPDNSAMMVGSLKKLAKWKGLKYQEAISSVGGTNTAAIQESSLTDTETIHIGLPLRNMHTPVEVCSWDDINNCVDLIIAEIGNLCTN